MKYHLIFCAREESEKLIFHFKELFHDETIYIENSNEIVSDLCSLQEHSYDELQYMYYIAYGYYLGSKGY